MTPAQCQICEHYGPAKIEDFTQMGEETVFVCRAFPKGIPQDLLSAKIPHDENVEGDNGIKFTPIKEEKPKA